MSNEFLLNAEPRSDAGKGASRRLRRLHDLVPAIIYGGEGEPRTIALPLNELKQSLNLEAFYSHILTIKIGKEKEQVVVRDIQRSPLSGFPIHCDFMRVVAGKEMTSRVPLHFLNEKTCPGVKTQGGKVQHNITEVNVSCLPKDLPEYIEVDLASMQLDDVVHLSDLKLPKGVTLLELAHGDEHDQPVVSIHLPAVAPAEEEETAEAEEAAEAPKAKKEAAEAEEEPEEGGEE